MVVERTCIEYRGYYVRRRQHNPNHWWIEKDQEFVDWCLNEDDGKERILALIDGRTPAPLIYDPKAGTLRYAQ